MKTKRCGNCGSRNIKITQDTGPFVWKDFPSAFLTKPIDMLQCEDCKEAILSLDMGPKIDKLIESSITENVQQYIQIIVDREHALQTELSERLGVTPEYLSEIKSGRKLPSFQTYNFLRILASDKKVYALSDPKKQARVRPVSA